MSLPAGWAQIPVTGTYVDRTGAPMAGKKISFESSQVVVIDGIEIVPKTITCRLDDTGSIPDDFTLPSTDDPDLSVTGWAYAVREHWTGGRTFNIFVEYDGGTINLPTASPVATPPELQSALSAEVVAAAHGYALAAEASAQAAEDAAADVGDSANAAAAAATDAQTAQAASEAAAAAAAASASSIGDSVTQAQAAQTAAESAASTATTKASEASTSATAAGTAQTAAETAQGAAETAKAAAETAATNAGNSATAASDSATAAAALIAGTALLRHGTGAPDNSLGNNGDYYLDDAAPKTLYGPKAAGTWPAGVSLQGGKGDPGPTGNSLTRPLNAALASSGGVITIDLSLGKEVYDITLTENVTGWTFTNPPAAGTVAEIRVNITQHASSAKTCVSPATAGTAGGAWSVSPVLGSKEALGIAIRSDGSRTVFPSGVLS